MLRSLTLVLLLLTPATCLQAQSEPPMHSGNRENAVRAAFISDPPAAHATGGGALSDARLEGGNPSSLSSISGAGRTGIFSPSPQGASTGNLVVGGTVGWALGLAGGAALGYLAQPDPGDSYVGAAEWWLGAWIGSSIGAATGVHIANRGQGNLLLASLGSVASAPVSLLLAVPLAEAGSIGVLVIPAAQIGASVLIERLTSRGRAP